ncbi:hypothetical protein D3C72_2588060 [compost metagenome]
MAGKELLNWGMVARATGVYQAVTEVVPPTTIWTRWLSVRPLKRGRETCICTSGRTSFCR